MESAQHLASAQQILVRAFPKGLSLAFLCHGTPSQPCPSAHLFPSPSSSLPPPGTLLACGLTGRSPSLVLSLLLREVSAATCWTHPVFLRLTQGTGSRGELGRESELRELPRWWKLEPASCLFHKGTQSPLEKGLA